MSAATPKPTPPPPVDPRTLPALALWTDQRYVRWVGWRYEWREKPDGSGKWTKVPKMLGGGNASNDDSATWSTFEAIWARRSKFDGIGFMLLGLPGIAAIDLDKVLDPQSGEPLPWAHDVVAECASYCETTPSGVGLRIIGSTTIARLHRNGSHPAGGSFELYVDCERYITVTGRANGSADLFSDITRPVNRLLKILDRKVKSAAPPLGGGRPIAIENLSGWVRELVKEGKSEGKAVEHPGRQCFTVVQHLHGAGFTQAQVIDLAGRYPQGVFGKYAGRLPKEIGRVWGKIDDGDSEPPPEPLRVVDPREFQGQPIPERQWIVPGWVPCGVATGFYGSGGIGKTLVSQQLMTAAALGRPWLGVPVAPARSIGLFCEDDLDELRRRQAAVNHQLYGCDLDALGATCWLPRLGENNLLMVFKRDGQGVLTPLFGQIREAALDFGAKLVVIDTVADTFGGNQNDAGQVRQYVQFCLARLARDIGGAVLACAHPSRAGINSGSGESGSVQWEAAFRSRLYLSAPKKGDDDDDDPVDPNARVLTRVKANYAARDEAIELRWHDGVLSAEGGNAEDQVRPDAEAVFLALLDKMIAEGQTLSPNSRAGNYAPKLLMNRPDRHGYRIRDFERAMQALLEIRDIRIEEYGRPSHRGQRIVRGEAAPF